MQAIKRELLVAEEKMASDLRQNLLKRQVSKEKADHYNSTLSENSSTCKPEVDKAQHSGDWNSLEKTFAKDLAGEKGDELRNKFFTEIGRLLTQYLNSEYKRSSKVVDFHHPHQLIEIMEPCLSIDREPQNLEEILSDCRETLKYCVKTGHPRFLNQLSTGVDVIGVAGEMVTAVTNTNMFTYEVAPVFSLIEGVVLKKMLECVGWADGEGIFSPGGSISNLYGMLAARHRKFPAVRSKGMSNVGQIVVFTSKHSHFSVDKAAMLLGFGRDNVIDIDCDDRGKMKVKHLRKKVKSALSNGQIPLMVNATCGTTVLGAYDPVNDIADVCEEFGIWLHVDGAWGGGALLSDKHKYLFSGIERADSLTWNPHKMMGATLQCSAILLREKGILMEVNQTGATYLYHKDKIYDTSYDTGDKTIQCGRHNDVFKLWLMWRSKGDNGFSDQIDTFFNLAKYLVNEIKKRPRFQLVLEQIEGPNVCFWYIPKDLGDVTEKNEEWKRRLHKIAPQLKALMLENGSMMVTYQPLGDLPNFFRIAVSNQALTREDLDFVLDEIEKLAENL